MSQPIRPSISKHSQKPSNTSTTATLLTPSTSSAFSPSSDGAFSFAAPTPMTTPSHSLFSGEDCDIIPHYGENNPRTLVLCFDGTGDQFDTDNSNIIQFFTLLKKDDRDKQMVYYQAGIGTYTVPEIATPFMANVQETLDEAIAWNMHAHVMGGYEFLMQNYKGGDKICIFGFSRGAYTARALAGMIHKVGLLPPCNHQQIPFAYKMFTREDQTGWDQSNAFKKAFSIDVDIEFIGVWDTVCSVGLVPRHLPFTASNTSIRTFRHALSLDEHRAKFKANLYNYPTEDEQKLGIQPGEMPKSGNGGFFRRRRQPRSPKRQLTELEDAFLKQESRENGHAIKETDVLEVWFAGCHCDVGGGSVPNDSKHNLARIPLRWMIRQCFLAHTGIRFHADLLPALGLDPAALYPVVKPRPPPVEGDLTTVSALLNAELRGEKLTEEEHDLIDSVENMYDQLQLAKWWWILEVIPFEHRTQGKDLKWTRKIYWNLGHGRVVPEHHQPFHVHRSVQTRRKLVKYVPNTRIQGKDKWVDPTEWAA